MNLTHIWPQEVKVADGYVTHSAFIEDSEPFTLWFRVPEASASLLSNRAESFVAGTMVQLMARGRDLRVHAPLSPSFLRNVDEFQAIWRCWNPALRHLSIEADSESESSVSQPDRAVAMFSGGVDSCYTVWRHKKGTAGRRTLPLQTAVMLHGIDIGLNEDEKLAVAKKRSENMLSAIDLELIVLATNYRELFARDYVRKLFGSMLSACLLLFQESHSSGLLAASFSYDTLVLPYGSTPLTDPLFSTSRFPIEHDAAGYSRFEKVQEIVEWPEVLENLRVCNELPYTHVNCGRCDKCIRNILTFRIAGVQNPACFPNTLSDADIERVRMKGTGTTSMMRLIEAAHAANIQDSWLPAVEKSVRRSQRRERFNDVWKPIHNRIRAAKPKKLLAIVRSGQQR